MDQYVTTFRKVEAGAYKDVQAALKALADNISASIATGNQAELKKLVDGQMAKLSKTA
jgi:hypothetical protein